MAADSPVTEARPAANRIVFLDLARAGAVLFMIQGHAIHQFLDPVYERSLPFLWWLFLRGLTSCLFFLLSGFAFSIASHKHWDEIRRPTARLLRRVTRLTFFLALGYLIHFPMGRFEHLKFANDERWRSFLQVDVLQLVAASLLLLQVLAMLIGTRRRFAIASAVIGTAIVVATPVMWARSWANDVPLWLASYLSSETGSIFPFFSWGAFVFFGAALGMAYVRRGAGWPAARTALAFAGAGGLLALAGVVAFRLPLDPFGGVDPWRAGPAMFVIRLGCVLVLLSGFAYGSRFIHRLPQFITALSQESLIIYVVHVAALYGSLWAPGLGPLLGRQSLGGTIAWIGLLFVSMTLLAWVWNWTKRTRPVLIHAIRFAIAVALIWPLL